MPDAVSQGPTVDSLIGRQLANFRIDRLIKRGGMSHVYYGWDVMLQRSLAIKVIDVRYRSSQSYAERFLREARAMAAWRHQNIVQIHYADKNDGLYYFVMEYIDGMDLRGLIAKYAENDELIPHRDVLDIGWGIAHALDYAHAHGVIHRDVKPSNVMVSTEGRVVLTDFGLALTIKDESEGEIFGTPHYIAPEQAMRSTFAVPQSDLYSLAVIFYEMLAGAPPFDDPSPTSLALQHVSQEPPSPREFNPYLTHEVAAVLLKGLGKTPEERYQTGADLVDALESAMQVGEMIPGGRLTLPPLPATAETESLPDGRLQLSRMSVVDRIALELGMSEEEGTVAAETEKRNRRARMIGGAVLAALTVLLMFLALWFDGRDGDQGTPTPLSGFAAETATAVAFALRPTETSTPTPTPTPTAPPPTATSTPTSTPSPSATATPTAPPTMTATAVTPTIARPNVGPTATRRGLPIRFLYDEYSFYAWNPGVQPINVGLLSFEALHRDGTSADYIFRGRVWTGFYPTLDYRACMGIEPLGVPATMDPPECRTNNATLTPRLDDESIFWIPRRDITQFRVFWSGEEIGRCPIVTGICDLTIPQ